jgi:hypothetical protein
MARISEIRKGLKDRLETIVGLHVYATMPAAPQSPAAAVIPRSKARLSFDDDAVYQLSVWVYVNPSDLNRAQTQIDDYLSDEGSKSIEAAIEADPSLGGAAESTTVIGWSEYAQLVTIGDGQLLGGRIDVEVMA